MSKQLKKDLDKGQLEYLVELLKNISQQDITKLSEHYALCSLSDVVRDTLSLTCKEIAYDKYEAGIEPTWSKAICDSLTVGYGELCKYGYFEYPLVIDDESETPKIIPRQFAI